MLQSVKQPNLAADESSTLPVSDGLVAGLLGTGILLIFVFGMMATLDTDVWTAAHDTLSVLLGADYFPDTFQIIAGTIVHLVVSAILGAIFGSMTCKVATWGIPRDFWIVAGLIFGIGTGAVACILTKPLMMIFGIAGSVNYFWVMWFNVVYGFLYGLAAATYGLEWAFIIRLRRRIFAQ